MPVVFRPAQCTDAREIARLFQITSEGASDYIWSQLAEPGEALLDVGARRYAREDVDFSYQNCLIDYAENTGARRFYERHGFNIVKTCQIVPHPMIRVTGEAYLMQRL